MSIGTNERRQKESELTAEQCHLEALLRKIDHPRKTHKDFWLQVLGIIERAGTFNLPSYSNIPQGGLFFGAKLDLDYSTPEVPERRLEIHVGNSSAWPETVQLAITDINVTAGVDTSKNWKERRMVFEGFCEVPIGVQSHEFVAQFPYFHNFAKDFRTHIFREGFWYSFFFDKKLNDCKVNEEVFRADPKLAPLFETALERRIQRTRDLAEFVRHCME